MFSKCFQNVFKMIDEIIDEIIDFNEHQILLKQTSSIMRDYAFV